MAKSIDLTVPITAQQCYDAGHSITTVVQTKLRFANPAVVNLCIRAFPTAEHARWTFVELTRAQLCEMMVLLDVHGKAASAPSASPPNEEIPQMPPSPSLSPLTLHLRTTLAQLAASNAPDHAYRELFSTATRPGHRPGETWRAKAERWLQQCESADAATGEAAAARMAELRAAIERELVACATAIRNRELSDDLAHTNGSIDPMRERELRLRKVLVHLTAGHRPPESIRLAHFVRQAAPGPRLTVKVWKLDQPVIIGGCCVEFIRTSASTLTSERQPETLIFACNSNGEITNWADLPGSTRGVLDHDLAIFNAGWVPCYTTPATPANHQGA